METRTPKKVLVATDFSVGSDEGFEKSVDAVVAIEKQLGIYELSQFTPRSE